MIVSTFRGLLFFLFLLTPLLLTAQESPEIQVEEQSFNFGLIPEEKGSVGHSFKFRNSGTAPLLITRVTADCGCTTPTWPEEAIAPGEDAEIRVLFDPVGRSGAFVKRIRVFSTQYKRHGYDPRWCHTACLCLGDRAATGEQCSPAFPYFHA